MYDLSEHILDIAENSVNAGANKIWINITEDIETDLLEIEIKDNGKGMTKEEAEQAKNPFVTSRTTRNVGLGIPLFKEAAEQSGGKLEISSAPGKGTTVKAIFGYGNIDRKPLGDMTETLISLMLLAKDKDIFYKRNNNGNEIEIDTMQLKKDLEIERLDDVVILNSLKKLFRNYKI